MAFFPFVFYKLTKLSKSNSKRIEIDKRLYKQLTDDFNWHLRIRLYTLHLFIEFSFVGMENLSSCLTNQPTNNNQKKRFFLTQTTLKTMKYNVQSAKFVMKRKNQPKIHKIWIFLFRILYSVFLLLWFNYSFSCRSFWLFHFTRYVYFCLFLLLSKKKISKFQHCIKNNAIENLLDDDINRSQRTYFFLSLSHSLSFFHLVFLFFFFWFCDVSNKFLKYVMKCTGEQITKHLTTTTR